LIRQVVVILKSVFMGSGDFSRDLLSALLQYGFEISAIITRPDRPAGRGLRMQATAVKDLAEKEGMPVLQPAGPRDPAFLAALDELRPELLLVADYGYLLPLAVLEYPPIGCVNVHPSLLPHYRGAAPIQRAIMQGERETGVTLMLLDEGMDTGDIIAMERLNIADDDNAVSLRSKLATLGARMLMDTLPSFASGDIAPRAQDETMATYADPLTKQDAIIDWSRNAEDLHNQVRALSPRPGAYTMLRDKRVKLLRTMAREDIVLDAPGRIALGEGDALLVGTGKGALLVEELQPEGKKPMGAPEFLRGYRLREGEAFG
jgi:methionyl-tRNA formyltransferase